MAETSLIIIGTGLAGLSAGCYAQMNGYRSQIFEHHAQPGGVAAAWRRKDYSIDGGIHFVMGHPAPIPAARRCRSCATTIGGGSPYKGERLTPQPGD